MSFIIDQTQNYLYDYHFQNDFIVFFYLKYILYHYFSFDSGVD